MSHSSRRAFLESAAAIGATAVFGRAAARASRMRARERREFFAEGVASADPDSNSVVLWTRYSNPGAAGRAALTVEVARDRAFERVIAIARAPVAAESDWTARVLVGNLEPASEYWYRFVDSGGNASRIGRTLTAPPDEDPRAVRFVFVSCQNVNQGAQNAYRRMIYEDEQAPPGERIDFILHLGDFIYEIVWYPEDRPQGMYDRRLRDVVRYADGEKIGDFHIPTTLADYRAVYRGYLKDPDLQDARARWPFVNMWDNHEFSWLGWQSLQKFQGSTRAAQTRKVAANQAFFEFQPARMRRPGVGRLDTRALEAFHAPHVENAPILRFDEHGLGDEPNNRAALASLTGYRALRFGRHLELIVTDQRSYRSEEPTDMEEAKPLANRDFPDMMPQTAMEILDAGRTYANGHPPARIQAADGSVDIANVWKERPAQSVFGAQQKSWFLERLERSTATWKVWGNTTATLDMRADPANLPEGVGKHWPWPGYAGFGGGDWSTAYVERAEIYDFVRSRGITGFATVAGDRHSFWGGLAAKSLPPQEFSPVGVAFVTGSISAPGFVEAYEHRLEKEHPLRALYLGQGPADSKPQPTINLLLRHGVRSCLEYARSGDIERARSLSNPELAPHLRFVDMGGHGYAVVRVGAHALETEFVCIPRPLQRAAAADGGPLNARVRLRSALWSKDETPGLEVVVMEGDPKFSI
jgi:alkaline phosphatase D